MQRWVKSELIRSQSWVVTHVIPNNFFNIFKGTLDTTRTTRDTWHVTWRVAEKSTQSERSNRRGMDFGDALAAEVRCPGLSPGGGTLLDIFWHTSYFFVFSYFAYSTLFLSLRFLSFSTSLSFFVASSYWFFRQHIFTFNKCTFHSPSRRCFSFLWRWFLCQDKRWCKDDAKMMKGNVKKKNIRIHLDHSWHMSTHVNTKWISLKTILPNPRWGGRSPKLTERCKA